MSDDDIPTTDEVRDKYAEFWIEGEYFGNDDAETRADFDRWLAQVRAAAWEQGREAGWDAGARYMWSGEPRHTPNPYQEETQDG